MSEDYGSVLARYNYQVQEDKNTALMQSLKSDPERAEKDGESETAVGLTGPYLAEKLVGYLKDKGTETLDAIKDNVSDTLEKLGGKIGESATKVFKGSKSATDTAIDNLGEADKSGTFRTTFNEIKTEYATASSDLEKAKAMPVDSTVDSKIYATRRGYEINTAEARLKSINVKANTLADDVSDTTKNLAYNQKNFDAVSVKAPEPVFENTIKNPAYNFERDVIQPRIRQIQSDSFDRVGNSDSFGLRMIDNRSQSDFSKANNNATDMEVMNDRLDGHWQALKDASGDKFEDPLVYEAAPVNTTRQLAQFGKVDNYASSAISGDKVPVLPTTAPKAVVARSALTTEEPAVARSALTTENILGEGSIGTRLGAFGSETAGAAKSSIQSLINNPTGNVARATEVANAAAKNTAGRLGIEEANVSSGAETAGEAGLSTVGEAAGEVGAEDLAIAGGAAGFGPIGLGVAAVAILGAALWHLFDPDESKPAVIPTPNYSNPVFQPGGR